MEIAKAVAGDSPTWFYPFAPSLNDSQVPYWEGTKFVAKIREMKTDTNPLLLKVNMGAGHGGSSGRYDALRETAADQAFMLTQMGISE